eukprot:TRINITY_DN2872_c0_g2_i1.p1 TRINITY_DN2872_c0_g2~~TRINITY_DN2872_c0_g2_i1.p1  ORF type:complete len:257 (+),score=62.60 TRINITY_DN2872_c0_g2_i1:1114-1884(+)
MSSLPALPALTALPTLPALTTLPTLPPAVATSASSPTYAPSPSFVPSVANSSTSVNVSEVPQDGKAAQVSHKESTSPTSSSPPTSPPPNNSATPVPVLPSLSSITSSISVSPNSSEDSKRDQKLEKKAKDFESLHTPDAVFFCLKPHTLEKTIPPLKKAAITTSDKAIISHIRKFLAKKFDIVSPDDIILCINKKLQSNSLYMDTPEGPIDIQRVVTCMGKTFLVLQDKTLLLALKNKFYGPGERFVLYYCKSGLF